MSKIKYIFISFLTLGLVFPVLFTLYHLGFFSSDPKIDIKSNVSDADAEVLRVVADYDFSPYSFYDKNNEVSGLDVELVNEIANRLGMKSEITFGDWPNCKLMLQEKKADLILGLEIFSHMNGVLKTVAASQDELLIFGKSKINNVADLKGKKVGLMVNSVIERFFDLNCEYVEYFTNTQILEAVESGQIDYGLCHGSVGKKIIEKKKLDLYPSIALMNSYPAIGVRDDLPELRDAITDVITQMSSDGTITALDEKWLVDFTQKRSLVEVFSIESRFYIIYFISFLITFFVLTFIYIQLKHKEKDLRKSLEYQDSLKKQNDILVSVAGVYYTMHIISLTQDNVREVSTSEIVREFVNRKENAAEQMRLVMENTVIHEDVEMALNFTNLSTLAERMMERDTLLAEFRGTKIGWFCAQFIAIERDEAGKVTDVMFTTQLIDEMKKEKERLLRLSSYDELTKLYNRHAYETKLEELSKSDNQHVSIIILDVNELKAVNDTIGHSAGDELICAAAENIRNAFDRIGSCFRIGGDEFAVIIENEIDSDIIAKFRDGLKSWHGKQVDHITVSLGYATSDEIENFSGEKYGELVKLSDQRMYADKASFYKKRGIDRRGLPEAFNIICNSYTKILKINLSDDSYQMIKVNVGEQEKSKGFSDRISVWLHKFALSGQVHPDDVENYVQKTDIDFLKKHFRDGNKELFVYYKRKIGEDFHDVVMELIPAKEYSNDNQILFLYVKNVGK